MKRYFVFLLWGLLMLPLFTFAKGETDTLGVRKLDETDTLGLGKSDVSNTSIQSKLPAKDTLGSANNSQANSQLNQQKTSPKTDSIGLVESKELEQLNLRRAKLYNLNRSSIPTASSQVEASAAPKSIVGYTNYSAQKPKKTWFKGLRVSGWARIYAFHRDMQSYYNIVPQQGLTLPVNLTIGDGYQQPMMLFRLEANPTAKTYFNYELQFDDRLKTLATTPISSDSLGHLASLYVIFRLQGAVDTRFGKFTMTAGGGANWYRLSPATLWQYQYRDDLFERYAWEPAGHDFARYNANYSTGDIPRDQRFGMQATQGFILEGKDLPLGFEAVGLYGKTQTGGGYQSYLSSTPQNFIGSRISKKISDHKIGVNYFNQYGYSGNQVQYKAVKEVGKDTFYVAANRISNLVTSLDGSFIFKNFSIYTEQGIGSYLSSTYNAGLRADAKAGINNVSRYKRNFGETMFFEITTKKGLTGIPLKFAAYRIDKDVVNLTSSTYNTSVEQAKPNSSVPDAYNIYYYDGMVTDVGQMTNNRQGLSLVGFKDFFNKLKTKFSWGMTQEIVNLAGDTRNGARAAAVNVNDTSATTKSPYSNSITFEHRLNGLTRSRFAFYERFTGPYDRLMSVFRRTYENIVITDLLVDYKKSFSTVDLELKYKLKLFGKEMILNNYANISSVQDHLAALPVVTDQAFLRIFYEEFMAFYAIHSKITLVGFLGGERVMGNKRTEEADANGKLIVDANGRPISSPNGKPINQYGYGFGTGIDYNFNSVASLHLRQRWFSHKDTNFTLDKFKGNEMTIELKIFF